MTKDGRVTLHLPMMDFVQITLSWELGLKTEEIVFEQDFKSL